jgi:hypothetical protein
MRQPSTRSTSGAVWLAAACLLAALQETMKAPFTLVGDGRSVSARR